VPEVVIHHDRAPKVHQTTTVIRDERPAPDGVARYNPGPPAEDVQRWTQRPVDRRDVTQIPNARPRDPAERRQPGPTLVRRPEEPVRRRLAPDDQSRPPMTQPTARSRSPDAGMVRRPEEPARRRGQADEDLVRRPEEPVRRLDAPGGGTPTARPGTAQRPPAAQLPPATQRPPVTQRPGTARQPDARRPSTDDRRRPPKVKGPSGPPPAVNSKRFTKPPGKVRPQPSARKRPTTRQKPPAQRRPPARARRPGTDDDRR
jgi:hypothetical protein